jgi:hypothetical protein
MILSPCSATKNGGDCSGVKERALDVMLICVLKGTVALHSLLKVTNSFFPLGEAIELNIVSLHAPKSSMNDETT